RVDAGLQRGDSDDRGGPRWQRRYGGAAAQGGGEGLDLGLDRAAQAAGEGHRVDQVGNRSLIARNGDVAWANRGQVLQRRLDVLLHHRPQRVEGNATCDNAAKSQLERARGERRDPRRIQGRVELDDLFVVDQGVTVAVES